MANIGKEPALFTMMLFIYINHVLMCFSGSGPNCTTGFLSSGKQVQEKAEDKLIPLAESVVQAHKSGSQGL